MNPQKNFKGKNIVLGVTGSIAVYKACELVRLLDNEGAIVHVVMTKGATQFVAPLSFQALSRNPVRSDIFNLSEESLMGHITLADNADLILVAPASADIIAKAAHGLCDDLLSTILVATRSPLFFAPAMNVNMYNNAAVQHNLTLLQKRGIRFIGPDEGSLACGYEGVGRLLEPVKIIEELKKNLKK